MRKEDYYYEQQENSKKGEIIKKYVFPNSYIKLKGL